MGTGAATPTLSALQERLGYRFAYEALLRQALTHRSHGASHNERLEFLGDSVLNCAVASMLYERFGRLDEGDLSRVRANLVKQQTLYEVAQRLELGAGLLLGEGEQKSGGFRRPSILADTLEAIFGAIFLDGGFDPAQQTIRRLYKPILDTVDPNTLGKDAKTLLQEWLQSRKIPLPVYAVVATHGAAHSQLFEVECAVPKLAIQVLGSGGSRRVAEQAAAKLALEQAQALMPATVRRPRRTGARAAAAEASSAAPEASAPPAAATGAAAARLEPAPEAKAASEPRPAAMDVHAAVAPVPVTPVAPMPARVRAAPDGAVTTRDAAAPPVEPSPAPAEGRRRAHAA